MYWMIVIIFALLSPAPSIADEIHFIEHKGEYHSLELALHRKKGEGAPVLYVHGATFPILNSFFYEFNDGSSWAGEINDAGFDAWGLDFVGFGRSSRPNYDDVRDDFSRADHAAFQIYRAAQEIKTITGRDKISIIAHSWGTIAAGRFAELHPELLDKLVIFGQIVPRDTKNLSNTTGLPDFKFVTVEKQRARFLSGVPKGIPPVLEEPDLQRWSRVYLNSDRDAFERSPHSVKIPTGPAKDAIVTFGGKWLYNPEIITAPTLVIHGEWDEFSTKEDALKLSEKLSNTKSKIITIEKATHLMHLEKGRHKLWSSVSDFLTKD